MTQKPKSSPGADALSLSLKALSELTSGQAKRRGKKRVLAPIRRRSFQGPKQALDSATSQGPMPRALAQSRPRSATGPITSPSAGAPTRLVSQATPGSISATAASPSPQTAPQHKRPQDPATPEKQAPRTDMPLRLSKLMTARGLCSRREADDLISRGMVKVDGQVIDQLGSKVLPNVEIELHPQAKSDLGNLVTILLNKPVGYVSSQPELGYDPAVILIKPESQFTPSDALSGNLTLQKSHFDGLAPAGRLDIDSQGLLVFTQNGQVAKHLIGDKSDVEKEYLVRVQGQLDAEGLKLLNHGLELDGVKLRPAKVEWLNEDQLRFILKEGRKRQIRRMCELVGLHVIGLKRVRIGQVRLGRLPEGQWRFLEPGETF